MLLPSWRRSLLLPLLLLLHLHTLLLPLLLPPNAPIQLSRCRSTSLHQ